MDILIDGKYTFEEVEQKLQELEQVKYEFEHTTVALKESNDRLKLALKSAKAGCWEWDLRTNENIWSDEIWDIYGLKSYKGSKPSYELWLQSIHPDDREMSASKVQAAASSGEELNVEWRVNNQDGNERWIMSRGEPEHDEYGNVIRYQGVVIDITERKKAEEDRILNEIRLKTILNIIQYRTDTSKEFLENALNEALKLTGSKIGYILFYNEELKQFILNTWSDNVMDECKIVQPPTMYELDNTGIWGDSVRQRKAVIINDYNSYHPSKKGYPKGHVNINKFMTTPIFSNDKIAAVVGVANKELDYNEVDVLQLTLLMDSVWKFVEIKRGEDALRDSEKKFRLAFHTNPDSINLNRLEDGCYIDINSGFTKIMGYTCEEVIGKTSLELSIWKNPEDRARLVDCLQKNGYVENMEAQFVGKDGNIRDGLMSASVLKIHDKNVIISITRDNTERKKAQDALKESEAKLQQAQKMEAIGVLAGGIAHDFNNILFPIIAYTEMLSDEIPKESPLRSSLDEIYAASMRAKDVVRQILTFARQEKGEVKLMKMQHIVKEALKLIRSTIPATIGIKDNIRKECGLINADPTQIHQIVMNLAINAYHAMEETGGTMTISLKEVELNPELNEQDLIGQDIQKGIYACLTISDTGVGITEDVKNKIFNPFFTTKPQGKGTGLGLSSVHGIVTSCGGFIRLNSEIGKGTEFNIYLPVAESYLKKDDVLQVNIPTQGGNDRILLVDDEVVLITLQKGMLERLGYHVTSRTSSLEALEAFRANPDKFDVVITDMAMPNMSGDKLAVELIKIRPDIPILLSTGFSTIMSEEKALSMGIKGFLMKPVAIRDIDKKIREVLDSNK